MTVGNNCVLMVAHFEQFVSKPYLCPAKVPTIGYGSTFYPNGQKVTLHDAPVSEKVARDLMMWELTNTATSINAVLKVAVTQAQYDSLVSFAYNVGTGAFRKSTLLRIINGGELKKDGWKRTITAEFGKWINANGRKLPGLVSRRSTEAFLFCEGVVKYFNAK